MSEEKPTYITEAEHEAKKKRIEAISEILDRYVTGKIDKGEATAEIEAITHAK